MKRTLSVLIILIMVFSTCLTIDAYDEQSGSENTELKSNYKASQEEYETDYKEEKIICKATLDDDFADDKVIVVLNHKTSLELKDYTPEDFKQINAESVDNLTSFQLDSIKKEYKESISKKINFFTAINKNVKRDSNDWILKKASEIARLEIAQKYKKYNTILRINLKENSKQTVLDSVKKLEKDHNIIIAEPDYKTKLCAVPNDQYYSYQRNPYSNYFMENAWSITCGSSNLTVGILDTGVDGTHPDLENNINSELSYNFVNNGESPLIDYNGHGTGVAGVVGAVGNNSIGIAGICWNVSLVSLKITDGNTGNTSFITDAINYATTNNIKILNLSSSISSPPNSLITAINNYDGIILCAAGNNSKDIDNELCPYKYPSILPNDNIISVAATKYNESLFSTSNYGNISVDIGANGYAVFTTNSSIAGGSNPSHPLYIYRQETSFATPQVTGIAALIKSKYPTISYKGIRSAILGNATQINALNGKVSTGGVVNAQNALSGVTNHKFTVIYYKNGGTGTSLPNTTIFYGIPSVISSNTYTKNNYSFVGWTAYRSSDNKWLYDNNGESEWYTSGSQPSGAEKHVFFDESVFQHESNVTNDYINLYAQWAPSDTLIGDVNLDGRISIQDANKIQQFLYGIIHLNNTQRLAADFNLDKRIDENDITAIQNYLING